MRRSILQTKFYLLSVLLSLASCSQDELAEQGTPLPDGMYPMTFTAVQVAPKNMPQTRVSEEENGMSSRWEDGDVIKVTVSGAGKNKETDCTLDENGNITKYAPQLYWQNTGEVTVNAWYSNIEGQDTDAGNAVSLSNQSSRLAYVLKAKETTARYAGGDIGLEFSHQLAKIRVKLENGSYEGDLSGATVKVKGYTSCTVTDGDVSGGSEEGYITMHKNGDWYEANLVPGTLQTSETFEIISADGKTTKASLKEDNVTLEKGIVHEITINVESKFILIDNVDEYTVTQNKPIIIRGDVTVNFKNYKVNECYEGATIKIESGSPTLIFEGTGNEIKCGEAPILLGPGAAVTIKGKTNDAKNSQLTVSAGNGYAGIGSGAGDSNSNIPDACGNITIENISLYANGGTSSIYSGAAIGTSGKYAGSCGDITIRNSTVHAQGGKGAAAIGIGCYIWVNNLECGNITIDNSKIYATVEYFNPYSSPEYEGYGACIGHGATIGNDYTVTVGEIRITTKEKETEFFSDNRFKRADDVTTGFYKAGKGSAKVLWNQVWKGVWFNDTQLTDGNSNGYPAM